MFSPKFMLATFAFVPLAVVAADVPSNGTKSMKEIVTSLETTGYGPVVDVSFDDGRWEVEAYKGDESLELSIDPATGKVLAEHRDDAEPRPPQDSLKLSKILSVLTDAGHADIEEVSFGRRYWEVETIRDGKQFELHVDPKTGKVISERLDD